MALNDERYGQLFAQAAEALDHCTPQEAAILGFLGGILSEIRTTRDLQQEQVAELKAVREASERLCGALNRDDGAFYVVVPE